MRRSRGVREHASVGALGGAPCSAALSGGWPCRAAAAWRLLGTWGRREGWRCARPLPSGSQQQSELGHPAGAGRELLSPLPCRELQGACPPPESSGQTPTESPLGVRSSDGRTTVRGTAPVLRLAGEKAEVGRKVGIVTHPSPLFQNPLCGACRAGRASPGPTPVSWLTLDLSLPARAVLQQIRWPCLPNVSRTQPSSRPSCQPPARTPVSLPAPGSDLPVGFPVASSPP